MCCVIVLVRDQRSVFSIVPACLFRISLGNTVGGGLEEFDEAQGILLIPLFLQSPKMAINFQLGRAC